MAPNPSEDFSPIGKLCLELCKASIAIGHEVKMSLKIGSSFLFRFCSENNVKSLPEDDVGKHRKKSKATRKRDRQRREAFLLKKPASSKASALVALDDRSHQESPEVSPSHLDDTAWPSVDTILTSSSSVDSRPPGSDTRPPGSDTNDFEDKSEFDSMTCATPPANNSLCICNIVPCVCLASKLLSPICDQPVVPSVKLKKTEVGWTTAANSSQRLCDNCSKPFLNSSHLCEDDNNENETSKCDSSHIHEEDVLDYNACSNVVLDSIYSTQDKIQILQKNCISLLKKEPTDFKLAKYCFSRSKYFQLLDKNLTLGVSMQKIVSLFNKEFEEQYKKHYED